MSDELTESIKLGEGCKLKAYQDSEGIWTIGYGRNLQELTISLWQAEEWLEEDIEKAFEEALKFEEFECFDNNKRREDVLVEMVFNMGAPRVREFKKMLAAIRSRRWDDAAAEMLDSKWAKQVGNRAIRLANKMRAG